MDNLDTLRSRLIDNIFVTKNTTLLEALDKIFASTESESERKIQLTQTLKDLLLMAEEDISYGRIMNDEALRKLDEEWMK